MFRPLLATLILSLACSSAFAAPPVKTNKIVIIPQQFSSAVAKSPYLLYSVYDQTNTALIAAFKTKQAATAYSQQLIDSGAYSNYHVAEYIIPSNITPY